jgi:hypothetical protein
MYQMCGNVTKELHLYLSDSKEIQYILKFPVQQFIKEYSVFPRQLSRTEKYMRNAFALDNFLPHERTHCIRNTLHWSSEA